MLSECDLTIFCQRQCFRAIYVTEVLLPATAGICYEDICNCKYAVSLACQNPVQITRSLVVLMLGRGGKGIGWDWVEPDWLGEYPWERERQDRTKAGICLVYAQSSRASHFPRHIGTIELKRTICLMVLWRDKHCGFSNEHKSKQNKVTKFLGYLLSTSLVSLLISLHFKFVQGICANDCKLLRLLCWQ